MKAFGYVRVSTQEQSDSGLSLEAQREAIIAECRRRGWTTVEIVEDRASSASDLKRPGIQRVLASLEAKQAGGLVVSRLDRLSRSVGDFAGLMGRAQAQGWELIVLDLGIDASTPSGEAMAGVLSVFAQFEHKLTAQRTREALAAKRAEGVKLGRPRAIPPELRRRMERERRNGATFASIAASLNREDVARAHGGTQWWPATVRAALTQND